MALMNETQFIFLYNRPNPRRIPIVATVITTTTVTLEMAAVVAVVAQEIFSKTQLNHKIK
jgi:hypothetical protein